MAGSLAADFWQAGKLGNVFHLVHDYGVVNVGRDAEGLGDLLRQQRSQVGSVIINGVVAQKGEHIVVDQISALFQWGEFSAAPRHGSKPPQVELLRRQSRLDGFKTDGELRHVAAEDTQRCRRVVHLFLEQQGLVFVNGNARGGGTGINGKNGVLGVRHGVSLCKLW